MSGDCNGIIIKTPEGGIAVETSPTQCQECQDHECPGKQGIPDPENGKTAIDEAIEADKKSTQREKLLTSFSRQSLQVLRAIADDECTEYLIICKHPNGVMQHGAISQLSKIECMTAIVSADIEKKLKGMLGENPGWLNTLLKEYGRGF